jgi:hypothetical protein
LANEKQSFIAATGDLGELWQHVWFLQIFFIQNNLVCWESYYHVGLSCYAFKNEGHSEQALTSAP